LGHARIVGDQTVPDDFHKTISDRRVDVNEPLDCRYWSRRLGVTPKDLRAAVARVGDGVDDVIRELAKEYLGGNR
jgi:hypothetical protein